MRRANSSTSSSSGPASSGSDSLPDVAPSTLRSAFVWTLVWILALEAAAFGLERVGSQSSGGFVASLAGYLERGRSTEARLRTLARSSDPADVTMFEAGWIDPQRWRDQPAKRSPESNGLIAFYGNSFTRQIQFHVRALEPGIETRMVFGPVAPPSHAFATFSADRDQHAADSVVLGVLVETLPGLHAMTRATESVVEPSPYTWPRYRLEAGRLVSVEPVLRSADDLREAFEARPERWRAHVAQLAAEDAFYSGVVFNASLLDRLALTRMLNAAWAISRQREESAKVLAELADPATSGSVAILLELLARFDALAEEDGRRAIVVLIDTPRVPAGAGPSIRALAERRGIEAIAAADTCPPDDPESFAADGHLSDACADRVAGQLLARLRRSEAAEARVGSNEREGATIR